MDYITVLGILAIVVPVFILNLISCTLGSLKTTFLLRDEFFKSAVCAAFSSIIMMFSFQQTGIFAYMAVFVAMIIGTYAPPKLMKMMEPDGLYVYYVTAPLEEGYELKAKIVSYDIKVLSEKVEDEDNKIVLFLTIFSKDKTSSKLVVENIKQYKYHRGTPHRRQKEDLG